MTAILELIRETEQWHAFHKARGRIGQIEAAGTRIRLRALHDALAAVDNGESKP